MSAPDGSLFAANLLSGATSPEVAHRLVRAAKKVSLTKEAQPRFAQQLPLATFESLSKLPARWAEAAVRTLDCDAPSFAECAAAALSDSRHSVRSALAGVKGLPLDLTDAVVTDLLDQGRFDTVVQLHRQLLGTPMMWARWLSHRSATPKQIPVRSRAVPLQVIASDAAAVELFVKHVESSDMAAHCLTFTASGEPHLADMLKFAQQRGDDTVSLLLGRLTASPAGCDQRTVDLLVAEYADQFHVPSGNLHSLEDPDAIRMWWHSGLHGAREGLLGGTEPASPVIAQVAADELRACADVSEFASYAFLMCSMAGTIHVGRDDAEGYAQTVSIGLGLLEELPPSELFVEYGGLANTLQAVHKGAADPATFASLAKRFAALCPRHAGPLTVMCPEAPIGVAELVAADPAKYGVDASTFYDHLTIDARWASEKVIWGDAPDLFSELVLNTARIPAVLDGLGLNHTRLYSRVITAVYEHMAAELGEDAAAWDAALGLVPDWQGTVRELTAIAATFRH